MGLIELEQKLVATRVAKAISSTNNKVSKINTVRVEIARILTYINQMKREALIKEFAHKKYLPIKLRRKSTRAQRNKLTKHQRFSKTERQRKREKVYSRRIFALKNIASL